VTRTITPDMIEQLAAAMWESRSTVADPRTWDTAGEMWQDAYRELAEVAWQAVRRIDGEAVEPDAGVEPTACGIQTR
jgi:hypothetical protein